ncbi:MAG: glycosyltransferase family 4 protein [Ardenticatenales bacterium]|nr:glycosyltransferase family 4 protein [Ardenticatenales bacterium]
MTPTAPPPAPPSYRVLMVAPTSFFGDYGCHVRILEEARTLQAMGHRVRIVTYHNGNDVPGLTVQRCLPIPWRGRYEVGSSRHKLAFDVLLSARVLQSALAFRPDVIHGHLHEGALIGGVVARLVRRPLVFDFQGSLSGEMVDHGFVREGGRWQAAARRLERRIDHRSEGIVTSTAFATEHLIEDFDVPRARIVALPDCVNAATFRPDVLTPAERASARRALGLPEAAPIVVYLGLLARHQGTNVLLHAARKVIDARPDVRFLIMGYPGTEWYVRRAEQLGLHEHVLFTGRVPYDQAPAHLALGDVAVAPKISTTEGSGKLLNYMAMALPTVTFDTPVNREYLGDDGLFATPFADPDAFAARILDALADPAGARATGERLRARAVEGFDWARAGETLVDVYRKVGAGGQGQRLDAHPSSPDLPPRQASSPSPSLGGGRRRVRVVGHRGERASSTNE